MVPEPGVCKSATKGLPSVLTLNVSNHTNDRTTAKHSYFLVGVIQSFDPKRTRLMGRNIVILAQSAADLIGEDKVWADEPIKLIAVARHHCSAKLLLQLLYGLLPHGACLSRASLLANTGLRECSQTGC